MLHKGSGEKLGSVLSPVRDELDPAIWDGDNLRPEVKEFCLSVVEDFLSTFIPTDEIGNYLQRLILIGSITGYQYDPDADLDVNILVDLDRLASERGLEKELLIYEMRGEVGAANGELYPGTEHPCNIFLATTPDMPPADGIYDLFTDTWQKRPGHPGDIDPYANLKESIDRAEEVAGKVDAKYGAAVRTYSEIERYPQSGLQIQRKFLRLMKSLKRILKNVVDERREIMDMARDQGIDPPQTSTPNVVYKYLEYNGLLDKLHEVSKWLRAYEESGHMTDFPSKAPRSLTEPSESEKGTTDTPMQLAARTGHPRRSEAKIKLAESIHDAPEPGDDKCIIDLSIGSGHFFSSHDYEHSEVAMMEGVDMIGFGNEPRAGEDILAGYIKGPKLYLFGDAETLDPDDLLTIQGMTNNPAEIWLNNNLLHRQGA